jgi:hypothetical protein
VSKPPVAKSGLDIGTLEGLETKLNTLLRLAEKKGEVFAQRQSKYGIPD